MMKRTLVSVFLLLVAGDAAAAESCALRPANLRCEYMANPLGIDEPRPRLSWELLAAEAKARGLKQRAYRVLVAASPKALAAGEADLWDSGRVESDETVGIAYSGKPLANWDRCFWKVRVWDQDGNESEWSEAAHWEMAAVDAGAWTGKWIASDLALQPLQKELKALPDFGTHVEGATNSLPSEWQWAGQLRPKTKGIDKAPAVYLRKPFHVAKKVRQATAYVCGLGLHELYVNGERVGDALLNPAPSDYQKRVLYNVYDVSKYCRQGENAMGVILGNGWFNLIIPHLLRFDEADYISPPQLLLQLRIEYQDGSTEVIATDESWKYTTNGPLTFNCLLGGETYDARKEMPGWSATNFDDRLWKDAQAVKAPEGKLAAQQLYPVRVLEAVPAKKVEKTNGVYRVDLGKDICGWAKFRLHGKAGQQVTVKYLGADSHTLGRYQTCMFVLSGMEKEFTSRFHYAGFRYIEMTGLEDMPACSQITGQVVNSDLPIIGSFACSNEKLTRLQQILINTVRNYIIHIPNDPVREKAGWTQDVQNGFDVNAYNFDATAMYRKWQRDFIDIMFENGYVPPVAPSRFAGQNINGPWWGGMILYTPFKLYRYYQDEAMIRESYGALKKYMGYLDSIAQDHVIEWGLGEWLEPFAKNNKYTRKTPVPLTSTCAYYYYADIMRQFAGLLNQREDEKHYQELAAAIKESFNRHFYHPQTAQYAAGSQGAQLMALYCGLVPEAERDRVVVALREQIIRDKQHLSTGFVATPFLLTGLSDAGLGDLSYSMATQETYPSWFDMVFNQGNTVFKEDWDGGKVQMPSLAGPIGYWFFHSLAGIRLDETVPAFKRIVIKPDLVGDLTWASASYHSVRGEIATRWSRTNSTFTLSVQIPPNTTAIVHLPSESSQEIHEGGRALQQSGGIKVTACKGHETLISVGSGMYDFEVPLKQ